MKNESIDKSPPSFRRFHACAALAGVAFVGCRTEVVDLTPGGNPSLSVTVGVQDSGSGFGGIEEVPNGSDAIVVVEPAMAVEPPVSESADASVPAESSGVDAGEATQTTEVTEPSMPTVGPPPAPPPPAPPPAPPPPPVDVPDSDDIVSGTCGKLDVLFIVDNSQSTGVMQERLVSSIPDFIEGVETLGAEDYHFMVVDSDATSLAQFASLEDVLGGNLSCEPAATCCRDHCVLASIPFVNLFVSSCNQEPCADVFASADSCEGALGVGHRQSGDGDGCGFAGQGRYIDQGQPELSQALSCAAHVGTTGVRGAQPAAALVSALSPWHNGRGGCNEGFLREDAVLAVVLVTAEDDSGSPGDPEKWREAVIDAKGNEQVVVVLGLVGDENVPGGLPGGPCADIPEGAPLLQEFVSSFESGILASACAPDYGPAFTEALGSIALACERAPQLEFER